jgi:hypothetical protein
VGQAATHEQSGSRPVTCATDALKEHQDVTAVSRFRTGWIQAATSYSCLASNGFVMAIVRDSDGGDRCRSQMIVPTLHRPFTLA